MLEANPRYRGFIWDFEPVQGDARDAELVRTMRGRTMPQIGRVEISIIEEFQTQWLSFRGGQADLLNLPSAFRTDAFDVDDRLNPSLAAAGVTVYSYIDPEVIYAFFNFDDPLVGGFSREKVALRRALILAYRVDDDINLIRRRMAVEAQMPVPQGVVGHDPKYPSSTSAIRSSPIGSSTTFGYRRGADGWRTLPRWPPARSHPPGLARHGRGSRAQRTVEEVARRDRRAHRVRHRAVPGEFQGGQAVQAHDVGVVVGRGLPRWRELRAAPLRPELRTEQQQFYRSKRFDAFYEKAIAMPDSPERNRLFLEMSRQMEVDGAWSLQASRERRWLIRPQVQGFKRHPILHAKWRSVRMAR